MSKHTPEWGRRDSWRKHGKDFMVEVYHYTETPREETSWYGEGEGPHRWNVYAYIYPKHPHFAAFKRDEGMWQEAGATLGFHGGVSLLEYPQYDDKVTCVKVGCDYNHLHDAPYTRMENREQASEIFDDADTLFERLTNMDSRATGA